MKNRSLWLTLKHNLSIEQYASLINCSLDDAYKIVREEMDVIPLDLIERSCEIFNCSMAYFLCEIE